MGREVRMVPANWEHPKDWEGIYKPLLIGYAKDFAEFKALVAEKGLEEAIEYWGGCPSKDDYMPDWTEEEATYYMMYETVTQGTPISPAFSTPEELARWLADTGASAFAFQTASYEAWLNVCRGEYAPSAVYTPQLGLVSGVEATNI